MIRTAHDVNEEELPVYDVCVIGSGPSGMSVCTEIRDSGLSVCVIESGETQRSPFADGLRRVEWEGIAVRDSSRERLLGGVSETWGGMSAPLDRIDFEARSYTQAHRGWPFRADALAPFMEQAAFRYRFPLLARFETDDFLNEEEKKEVPWHGLEPKVFLAVRPPLQFGKELSYVFRSSGVDLITGATVTELIPDRGVPREIREALCNVDAKRTIRIRARVFVLAAGTIENARILLNSKNASPAGLGNEYDQVGRYFMNHPKAYAGRISLQKQFPRGVQYFWKKTGRLSGYIGLRLSEDVQRSKKFLNSYVRLEPLYPWTFRKGLTEWKSWISRMRAFLSGLRHLRASLAMREGIGILRELPRVLVALPAVCRSIYERFRNPLPIALALRYFLEMEPLAENRVTLSKSSDALGTPIAHIRHRLSERDRATFEALRGTLKNECAEFGIGEMVGKEETIQWEDASHHLGGTRMGIDPRFSVVDSDLKVHRTDNLFVVGGSVFPTSGCANPTMVMVALSIRLAKHLRGSFFGVKEHAGWGSSSRSLPTLVIGAGERFKADILPVLESLPESFAITQVYARTSGVVFGKRTYTVLPLADLKAEDVEKVRLVYVSVPSQEVAHVLEKLTEHECSHLSLIVPTPVSRDVEIFAAKFRRVYTEEDCAFLPWVAALTRGSAPGGELGPLKKITIDCSAYRYHALALIKALCGGTAPARISRGIRVGNRIWLRVAGVRVLLKEPRDYNHGRLHIEGVRASACDRPEPGALAVECVHEGSLCVGFRIGKEYEPLSREESELFGAAQSGDTVVNRMHDIKRVGLRRMLERIAAEKEAWSLTEGRNDTALDEALHAFPLSFSF